MKISKDVEKELLDLFLKSVNEDDIDEMLKGTVLDIHSGNGVNFLKFEIRMGANGMLLDCSGTDLFKKMGEDFNFGKEVQKQIDRVVNEMKELTDVITEKINEGLNEEE